ncbi:MAG: hypothetical protein JWM27_73 [Gemmatimonadetes bacterium]|nr:hypothetical protein [Gemmatimonadota bacterium]
MCGARPAALPPPPTHPPSARFPLPTGLTTLRLPPPNQPRHVRVPEPIVPPFTSYHARQECPRRHPTIRRPCVRLSPRRRCAAAPNCRRWCRHCFARATSRLRGCRRIGCRSRPRRRSRSAPAHPPAAAVARAGRGDGAAAPVAAPHRVHDAAAPAAHPATDAATRAQRPAVHEPLPVGLTTALPPPSVVPTHERAVRPTPPPTPPFTSPLRPDPRRSPRCPAIRLSGRLSRSSRRSRSPHHSAGPGRRPPA